MIVILNDVIFVQPDMKRWAIHSVISFSCEVERFNIRLRFQFLEFERFRLRLPAPNPQ